jgi:hypothetical protein
MFESRIVNVHELKKHKYVMKWQFCTSVSMFDAILLSKVFEMNCTSDLASAVIGSCLAESDYFEPTLKIRSIGVGDGIDDINVVGKRTELMSASAF